MSTPLAAFGPGIAICQRTDIANSPAVNVGFAQEFSLDTSASNKSLFGQKKFALAVAQGTIKVTGKLKNATLSGLAWNNLFFGQSFTPGGWQWVVDEPQAVPATPFTVTVTNAATFDIDLGVKYAANGLPLQRVAAGLEAAGKYSVTQAGGNKGKYVFATADTGLMMLFTYTQTTNVGQTLTVMNTLIGVTPTFQLDYYTALNQPATKPFVVRIYGAVGNKLGLGSKLEDWIMPEIDFDIFADPQDRVYSFVFPEVA